MGAGVGPGSCRSSGRWHCRPHREGAAGWAVWGQWCWGGPESFVWEGWQGWLWVGWPRSRHGGGTGRSRAGCETPPSTSTGAVAAPGLLCASPPSPLPKRAAGERAGAMPPRPGAQRGSGAPAAPGVGVP